MVRSCITKINTSWYPINSTSVGQYVNNELHLSGNLTRRSFSLSHDSLFSLHLLLIRIVLSLSFTVSLVLMFSVFSTAPYTHPVTELCVVRTTHSVYDKSRGQFWTWPLQSHTMDITIGPHPLSNFLLASGLYVFVRARLTSNRLNSSAISCASSSPRSAMILSKHPYWQIPSLIRNRHMVAVVLFIRACVLHLVF